LSGGIRKNASGELKIRKRMGNRTDRRGRITAVKTRQQEAQSEDLQ